MREAIMYQYAVIATEPQFNPKKFVDDNPTVILIGGLLLAFGLITWLTGMSPKKGKTARGRWATPEDIANAKKVGLACLGKNSKFDKATYYIQEPIGTPPSQWQKPEKSQPLFFPQINRGALIVGGPGSGKTANFIEPAAISAILQHATVVLFDYKFQNQGLAESLIPVAIDQGYQVRVLAPGSILSGTFNVGDLIKNSADLAGAREVVSCIVRNTTSKDAKTDGFFDAGGSSILEGAFLMARWIAEIHQDPSLCNILMVSQILSLPNLSRRLMLNRSRMPSWCFSAFSILTASGGEEKNDTEAGLLATAAKFLSPMIVPNFLSSFCGASTFPRFEDNEPLKADGKQMLVFGVNQMNEQSTLPLIATALEQIVNYNVKYKRSKPLVVVLDEFPTLNMPVVLDWLNRYRSSGCSLIIGIQYLGQLEARYGKALAEGFLAGTSTKLWFNPGNPETAKVMSDILGKQEVELPNISKSRSFGKGGGGSRSESTHLHQIALLEPHEPLQFPQGTCVVQCPAVGNKEAVSLPFKHSFRFSGKLNDRFKAESAGKFNLLLQAAEATKPKEAVDFAAVMATYYELLDGILALNPDHADPVPGIDI
jgi:type IV secretion system protein VirD4